MQREQKIKIERKGIVGKMGYLSWGDRFKRQHGREGNRSNYSMLPEYHVALPTW